MRRHNAESAFAAFSVIALIVLGSYVVVVGWGKQEVVECLQWQQQAKDFGGIAPASQFYIRQWQKDQCDAHGITVIAPVK